MSRTIRPGGPLMRFPAVIHKDEETGYGVTVPDLPGCFSAGDTDEAAAREGETRSGLLARAALSYVQRQSTGT